jgi:hypothetical protein
MALNLSPRIGVSHRRDRENNGHSALRLNPREISLQEPDGSGCREQSSSDPALNSWPKASITFCSGTARALKPYDPDPTYSAEYVENLATLPFGGAAFTS